MLMSETARLVLSYLLELDYRETREKFMSECPAIAELKSLGPKELSYACRVNNRTLTDLLKEYISLETQIRKLAEEISTEEDEDLQFDRPLRILKIIRDLLKKRDSVSQKNAVAETTETSTQTQHVEISRATSFLNLQKSSTVRINNEDTQTVKVPPKRSGSGPPRSSDGDKAPFFHTNIRVIPKVRTGFVPILPRSPAKPAAPAPPPEETASENTSADKSIKKSKTQEKQMQSSEVFDKIELVDLGKKIATAIPVNLDGVNSTNISAIADKYLDDDDLFNNLLEAYSSFNPTTEIESDQEMNTPVTSPMPDDLSHEEISEQNLVEIENSTGDEGETTDSNKNQEPKVAEETNQDADRNDTLAQIVQSTISVVTENYEEDTAPLKNEKESLSLNQPKVKEPRVRKRSSKNLKKRKDDDAQVNSFQRQLRGIIDINSSVHQTNSGKDKQVSKPKPQLMEDNLIMSKFAFLCNEKINIPTEDKIKDTTTTSKPNEEEKQASVVITNVDTKSQNSKPTKMKPAKRQRCKKCSACLAEPCGNCPPCRDKVCNGGRGILKKGCIEQRCLTLASKNEADDKTDEIIIDNNQATRHSKSSKKISSKKNSSVQSPYRPILASPAKDVNKISIGISGGRPVHVRNLGFTSNSKPGVPQKEKESVKAPQLGSSEPRNLPTVLKRVPVTTTSTGFEVKKLTPLPHNPFLVRKDMSMINEPTTINLAYNPQIPPAPLQHPNTAVPVPNSTAKPLQVIQEPSNVASAPKTIQTPPKKNLKTKTQTWDESLRAILGSAEKDTSHKKSPKKRSKRKSPKKLQSESEDDEELELGSELNLQDTDITPEAQQILDTFANQLLEKIEEKVAENVVHIQPKPAFENKKLFGPTNPTLKGKHVKEKDCICCKVESIVRSRKSASPPAPHVEEKTEETECKSQVTPEKAPERNTETSPSFPSSKSPDFVFKTPIKTVAGLLTTPSKAAPRLEGITSLEDRALLLSPATPTRHIPASPVAGLFSPLSRTPLSARRSRHQSSLHTPTHDLTQDKDAAFNSPVTPNSKQSPAPYYTPSPQSDYSVPSPTFTPGLKFLQEEGERLSQSDDSCSSASPSPGKNRITGAQKRKTFRNLFKKTTTEAAGKELGSMLEQKILNYPFSQRDDNTLPPVKKTPSPLISPVRASYDYTSSPQITMGLSPGADDLATENSMSRQSSFVSPNRTCYLSPTVVAMSTSVLGINQTLTPVLASESEKNDDVDIEAEDEDLNLELEASDEENNENPKPADTVLSNSLMAEQSSEDSQGKGLLSSDVKKSSPSSLDSSNKKSQGSVVEEEPEIKQKPPRRCALISSKRKSPLKNDSTKFEQQFDANNLDKNRSSNASLFLDENINSLESDDEKQTVINSQVEARRSPRKHKRKASISPKYNSKRKRNTLLINGTDKNINEKKESDNKIEKNDLQLQVEQTSKAKKKENAKSEGKAQETHHKSSAETCVSSKKQEENKKSTISKSEFFVFQSMMPFGEFDE